MSDILGNQKIVRKIAELKALGLSDQNIAESIRDEFGIEMPDIKLIKGIIKSYSVKGTEFIEKDKEIALIYKKLLHDLIDEGRDNLKIMQEAKRILFTKMKIYEENSALGTEAESRKATKELVNYIERIQNTIRTQNDNIKTLKQMLDILSQHRKEVTSSVVGIQSISQHLSELEKSGYITINPEYREIAGYEVDRSNLTEIKGGKKINGRTEREEQRIGEISDVRDRQEESEKGTKRVEVSENGSGD